MKKLILAFLLVLVASVSYAEEEFSFMLDKVEVVNDVLDISDQIQKLPNLKQGAVYSLQLEQWLPMTSATVMKMPYLEDLVEIDVGYVGPDKLVIALSIEIFNLKEATNIDMPILESIKIKPCIYYGVEKLFNGSADDDWGIGTSLLEFKF